MRSFLASGFAALAVIGAGSASAGTSKQCFMLLGDAARDPGTALASFDGDQVHLYFRRSIAPYNQMLGGGKFEDVAAEMSDQGLRKVSRGSDGSMNFDNGQLANYSITIVGNGLSGVITNPKGAKFPITGSCS